MKERLSAQLARRIVGHIRELALPRGQHLAAQELADLFKVSRAPVAVALKSLHEAGALRFVANRGYFVDDVPDTLPGPTSEAEHSEDRLYFAVAEDCLSGRLPARVSENDLMRLYGVSRLRLQMLLKQIAEEGWVVRLPGHGWEFQSILDSADAYAQAYRFRAAIEAEAVRQPGFTVNAEELEAARRQQRGLVAGEMFSLPRDRLYEINSTLHEMIVSWSRNSFFLDAIRRVNRQRRLIEYRATVDRSRIADQCKDHLAILDLLEKGYYGAASELLRGHIGKALAAKKDRAG